MYMKYKEMYQSFIGTLIICILIGLLIGILILVIVDRRLSQIRIHVPKPEVQINWPIEHMTSVKQDEKREEKLVVKENFVGSRPEVKEELVYDDSDTEVEDDDVVESFHGDRTRQSGFAPNMMKTQVQYGYPANMSLKEYRDWLWMFAGQEDALSLEHRQNFEILKRGGEIRRVPEAHQIPPLNADDMYIHQYPTGGVGVNLPMAQRLNDIKGGVRASNSDEYANASDEWDVWGQSGSIQNPDLGRKVDANALIRKITPQIRFPPAPFGAPSPTDPSVRGEKDPIEQSYNCKNNT